MNFWKKKEDGEEEQFTQEGAKAPASTNVSSSATSPATRGEPTVLTSSTEKAAEVKSPSAASGGSLEDRFGKVRSALGVGTVIQGKLSFDTPVSIDGKLSGEIFSSKELIVGQSGEIDAEVDVACLVIRGQVKGKIRATERIEIWSGGRLDGDIQTPSLIIEEGAKFNGACGMESKSKGATQSSSKVEGGKEASGKASDNKEKGSDKELRVH